MLNVKECLYIAPYLNPIGYMKKLFLITVTAVLNLTLNAQTDPGFIPLKELFGNDFLIGVAVNGRTITGDAGKMVIDNFNTLTCENEMKPQGLLYFPVQRPAGAPQGQNAQQRPANQPQGGQQGQAGQGGQPRMGMGGFSQGPLKLDTIKGLVFNWTSADNIAEFARTNRMQMRGHTLVWHSQTSSWIQNYNRQQMLAAMKNHIYELLEHWKGQILEWDVVNEAVADGGRSLRSSFWSNNIGDDFIDSAFVYAHQADPDAMLYYNDYGADGINSKSDFIYNMACRSHCICS